MSHIADAKIRSYGDTMEELFANALAAVIRLWIGRQRPKSTETRQEIFTAPSKERLLFEFLEYLIGLSDSEGIIPVELEWIEIEDSEHSLRLEAMIGYAPMRNYRIETGIKAMTYGMMRFGKRAGRYYAQFLLDL